MKCPYCGCEMEKGYISAPRGAYWVNNKRFAFFPRKSKGDVTIVGIFSSSPGENSYLCRKCGKVVIDVKEYPADENY